MTEKKTKAEKAFEDSRSGHRNQGFIEGLDWAISFVKVQEYNQLSKKYLIDNLEQKIHERTVD